jgi:hypothetical protein
VVAPSSVLTAHRSSEQPLLGLGPDRHPSPIHGGSTTLTAHRAYVTPEGGPGIGEVKIRAEGTHTLSLFACPWLNWGCFYQVQTPADPLFKEDSPSSTSVGREDTQAGMS